MKESIDHSFAIVAYKDSPYLAECIESLLKQKVSSLIYICTSSPSDYISGIAEHFSLDLYVTESNKGIAHDWNFALEMARTKYVTITHQDDIYLPDYSLNCFKECEKDPDSLICFTNYSEILVQAERRPTLILGVKRLVLKFFFPFGALRNTFLKKRFLALGCYISCPTVFFNKTRLGEFEFNRNFRISLDWEAWVQLANKEGAFRYVSEPLVYHRIHSESATTSGIASNTRAEEDLFIISSLWPKYLSKLIAKLYQTSYETNKV